MRRVAADKKGAIAAYEKGCAANDQMACAYKGHFQAKGLPEYDAGYKEGFALAKKACDAEPKSCGLLAALDYGLEASNFKSQRELNDKACKAGDQGGCYYIGRELYGEEATKAEGKKLLDGACAANVYAACTWTASGADRMKGEAVTCEKGGMGWPNEAQFACDFLAEANATGKDMPVDMKKAAALYQKACDLGLQSSCMKAIAAQ